MPLFDINTLVAGFSIGIAAFRAGNSQNNVCMNVTPRKLPSAMVNALDPRLRKS